MIRVGLQPFHTPLHKSHNRTVRARAIAPPARQTPARDRTVKNTAGSPFFQQRRPVILVHGRLDEVFVLRVAQRAVRRVPPPRRAHVPHGGGVLATLDRPDVLAAVHHVAHEQVLVQRGRVRVPVQRARRG